MENNQENNVAQNVSSGAEKVKRVEEELVTKEVTPEEKERAAAKSREQAAKTRAEEKKNEKRERKELALKRRAEKLKKRKEKKEKRRKSSGNGGWIAAVVTLGTATLALATIVTAGAMNLTTANGTLLSGYMDSVYKIDGATDNMQSALSKLRVTTSKTEQTKLLSALLTDGEVVSADLSKVPIDAYTASSLTSFLSKTSSFAKDCLVKLVNGKELTEGDKQTISYLYETNSKIRSELDDVCHKMCAKDMLELTKGTADGLLTRTFSSVRQRTLTSPSLPLEGAFGEEESEVTLKALEKEKEISSAEGEEIVKKVLKEYRLSDVECTGQASVKGFTCYNYRARDSRSREFFVQLTKSGGKLMQFNSFEECFANNFNTEQSLAIAEEFLSACGFENLSPVSVVETGTTTDLLFCHDEDGVLCLSDKVKVKVCSTRGIVTGVEAFSYWLNHGERQIESPRLTREDILSRAAGLKEESVRLALVPVNGEEILCYELTGSMDEETYAVYYDANTGEEVALFFVENSDAGRLLV